MADSTRDVAGEGPPNPDGRGLLHDGERTLAVQLDECYGLSRAGQICWLSRSTLALNGGNDVDALGRTSQETERDD
jgi:hypothetical protein